MPGWHERWGGVPKVARPVRGQAAGTAEPLGATAGDLAPADHTLW